MTDKMIEWVEIELFDDDTTDIDEPEGDEYGDNGYPEGLQRIKLSKLVQTPLGIFTADDSFHPLRDLPVYLAHLNFPVMESMIELLDNVPGIEAFRVVGRYRIAFIFAKLFNENEVMDAIEAALGIENQDVLMPDDTQELPEKAKEILRDIQKHIESEHWILYVFPNGKYKLLNLESKEDIEKHQSDFDGLKKISGGIVYSSLLME